MDTLGKRLNWFIIFFVFYVLVLISRLFIVQVLHGHEYQALVKRQSEQRRVVTGLRGEITDRFGRTMARSVPQQVQIHRVGDSSRIIRTSRLYPHGSVGGQILGFTGRDGTGLAGIEYRFEEELKGKPGSAYHMRDGKGTRFKKAHDLGSDSLVGNTVKVTLDLELQEIVEHVLVSTVKEFEAKSAMAVVMNPQNGEIFAMASVPHYNPNYGFPQNKLAAQLLPITENYEPGSTFKVLTLAAALEEKLYSSTDSIDGEQGQFKIYDQIIRDHKAYDSLSLEQSLAYSSNVAFAQIGDSLGKDRLYRYLRDFGFGSKTKVALSGEERGLVHPVRQWSGRSTVTIAFGHEVMATLLQLVTAYSAVANGGELLRPHLIKSITASDGVVQYKSEKEVVRRVLSESTADTVRQMMRSVVEYGTARKIDFGSIQVAGKTGTSEKINKETGKYDREHVWASFVAMAPVDNPAVVIGVVVDDPKDVASGGKAAAPAVAEIFRRTMITPNMTLGGRLIGRQPIKMSGGVKKKKIYYPAMSNRVRTEARQICDSMMIPFIFIGDGDLIVNQSPLSSVHIVDEAPLILYTKKVLDSDSSSYLNIIPNCIGLSLKNAVNALSIKGVTPYFSGSGSVIVAQDPTAGTILYEEMNPVCTLYCEVPQ